MKKIQILAVVALLMMFGCSKDNLIDTEQDSIVVKENYQTIVNGELGNLKGDTRMGGTMGFIGTSINNNIYFIGCLPTGRNLLKKGKFSGNLPDIGKINSKLSIYEFLTCNEMPINSPPNYGEPLMYAVEAKGKIYVGTSDNCDISITGNVYPWYYTSISIDGGTFIGTATINSGVGKFIGLIGKKFKVYANGNSTSPGINLETGTISLSFSDFEYRN